mgnify:CR=1 FL=1
METISCNIVYVFNSRGTEIFGSINMTWGGFSTVRYSCRRQSVTIQTTDSNVMTKIKLWPYNVTRLKKRISGHHHITYIDNEVLQRASLLTMLCNKNINHVIIVPWYYTRKFAHFYKGRNVVCTKHTNHDFRSNLSRTFLH